MSEQDITAMFLSAYYGMSKLDEYPLKEYILKQIKEELEKRTYEEKDKEIAFAKEYKRQLQDLFLVIHKLDLPMELRHLVNLKLQEM